MFTPTSTFASGLRKTLLPLLLWASASGVCLLPPLSYSGYPPYAPEYLCSIFFCLLLSLLWVWLQRWRIPRALCLCLLTFFGVALYFSGFFTGYVSGMVLAIPLALAFGSLSFFYFDKALLIAGIAAFSQIAAAAIDTPHHIAALRYANAPHSDATAVIHIMLDEHAGIATFPAEAVPEKDVHALVDQYVSHGFVVFTHAYTTSSHTEKSLAVLFNVDKDDIDQTYRYYSRGAYLTQASVLDTVGHGRALDITNTSFIDFTPALANNPAVARHEVYNYSLIGELPGGLPFNFHDRMIIALSKAMRWLSTGIDSPLVQWFLTTGMGHDVHQEAEAKAVELALVARSVMSDFTERLSCCGERGTYYFTHLIFPHRPFIVDRECQVLPFDQWLGGWPNGMVYARQRWLTLYRQHFDQASCAAKDVFHMLDAIKGRHELDHATILIHSDHGSRIIGPNETSKQDRFGSFIAIRMPGLKPQVIDQPVRLDHLYRNLLQNDFSRLDFTRFGPTEDSPY